MPFWQEAACDRRAEVSYKIDILGNNFPPQGTEMS
jgi:hypothetical protein